MLRRVSQVRFVERERTLVFAGLDGGVSCIKNTLIISYGIKY